MYGVPLSFTYGSIWFKRGLKKSHFPERITVFISDSKFPVEEALPSSSTIISLCGSWHNTRIKWLITLFPSVLSPSTKHKVLLGYSNAVRYDDEMMYIWDPSSELGRWGICCYLGTTATTVVRCWVSIKSSGATSLGVRTSIRSRWRKFAASFFVDVEWDCFNSLNTAALIRTSSSIRVTPLARIKSWRIDRDSLKWALQYFPAFDVPWDISGRPK